MTSDPMMPIGRSRCGFLHSCAAVETASKPMYAKKTVAAPCKIPDVPKDTEVFEIKKAAIIGAGTMGGGIAMNYANAGIPVIIREVTQEALDRGMATIRKNYENSVKKGRFTQ